ncbi:MAG: ATP-binding protein [Spirochaetia bacterium]|nr:ATP-binding protein [Spirochaetia bacterium]MBQ6674295.1 ATP-binding protein [Spirochaetia bacterium]
MHAEIADFLVDCLQNSVEAKASKVILNYTEYVGDRIEVEIIDNGCGMSPEILKKVQDPFFTDGTKHVKRKVGLGVPFLIQAVSLSGGQFNIESEVGKGTKFSFSFDLKNIDTPPQGDLSAAVLQTMMFDGDFEFEFNRAQIIGGKENRYTVLRTELIEALGGDLSDASSIKLAKDFLRSQEEDLI